MQGYKGSCIAEFKPSYMYALYQFVVLQYILFHQTLQQNENIGGVTILKYQSILSCSFVLLDLRILYVKSGLCFYLCNVFMVHLSLSNVFFSYDLWQVLRIVLYFLF